MDQPSQPMASGETDHDPRGVAHGVDAVFHIARSICDPFCREQSDEYVRLGGLLGGFPIDDNQYNGAGLCAGLLQSGRPNFLASARVLNHWMWVDLGVNIAGFPLALVLHYPPVVMVVICVAAIIPSIVIRHLNREYEE